MATATGQPEFPQPNKNVKRSDVWIILTSQMVPLDTARNKVGTLATRDGLEIGVGCVLLGNCECDWVPFAEVLGQVDKQLPARKLFISPSTVDSGETQQQTQHSRPPANQRCAAIGRHLLTAKPPAVVTRRCLRKR
jgi:hypothetical protein